jgi:predicted ATPase/DNA-binding CsgD family transcriptional regulator
MIINELNKREIEILGLLAQGLANKEIANRLFLAPNTVKWYIQQLNSKFGTSNREEIVEEAKNRKLLNHETEAKPHYERPKSNLPRQSTPFVGRDGDLDELHAILEKTDLRLITILAQGGMGKTRLALEAAEQQAERFRDGVFFIGLQALSETEQIIPTFAEGLSFYLQSDERSQKQQVLDFLTNKEMLLVTDNWEHLLDEVSLLSDILEAAPRVKILATSREKLKLLGETVYVLQGMAFPSWESPEDALRYDAVQLLVQAAQRVKPDWRVSQDNLDYVARVCRLTQGMPLGILLAVSWLDMLSIEEIAQEIAKSADFLEAQFANVPERQHSIRAVFNASWKRLSPQEQAVFMKLSVFRGGFTREAAKEVAGASLPILHRLMEKALVMRTSDERYDLHELLRQYAEEKLRESGEEAAVRASHAAYYLGMAASLNEALKTSGQKEAFERITQNLENIRIAWFFSVKNEQFENLAAAADSLRLVAQFGFLWHSIYDCFSTAMQKLESQGDNQSLLFAQISMFHAVYTLSVSYERSPKEIALRQVERAIDIAEAHHSFFEVYFGKVTRIRFLHSFGQLDKLLDLAWEAHEIAKGLDSPYYLANSYIGLAFAVHPTEHWRDGLKYLEKAYDLYTKIGNSIGLARLLADFSSFYMRVSELEKAEDYAWQALSAMQDLGFVNEIMFAQSHLAWILWDQGRVEEAEPYAQEVYKLAKDLNHEGWIKQSATFLGHIKAAKGFFQEALDFLLQEIPLNDAPWTGPLLPFLGMAGQVKKMREVFIEGLKKDHVLEFAYVTRLQIVELVYYIPILVEDWGISRSTACLSMIFNHPACPKIYTVHAHTQKCLQEWEADLGKEAFEAAWEEGKLLDIVEVLKEILAFYRSQ